MSAKSAESVVIPVPFWRKYLYWLLGGFAFLVFANSIANGYNMDDELVTRKHKFTSKGLQSVTKIFTSPYYSDNMGYAYGYRPMVHLSYAIEHQFFGENPKVSHFFNVLLFALTVLVFFRLLLLWTGEKGLSLALTAAVLFAVHPVHTEVVNSLKNRDEILALLFGLTAGIFAIRFSEKKSWKYLVLSILFWIAALLSKKSSYPLVFILPAGLILFSHISFRELLFLQAGWLIPGSWILADTIDVKWLLLMLVPAVFSFAFWYFMNRKENVPVQLKSIMENNRLFSIAIVTGSFFLLIFAYAEFSIWPFLLGLSGVLILAWIKPSHGIAFLSVFLALAGFLFSFFHFSVVAVFIAIWFVLGNKRIGKSRLYPFAIPLFSILFFLFRFPEPGNGILVFVAAFVLLLLAKKPVPGYIFAVLVSVAIFFISDGPGGLPFYFLLSAGAYFIKGRVASPYVFRTTISLLIIVAFFSANRQVQAWAFPPEPTSAQVVQNSEIRVSELQEGRKLEYGENTLVAPHTFAEKIGTGAATLGEYLRLMVFPYELSFYYGFARTKTEGPANPWVWLSILLHGALALFAFFQWKKRPLLAWGIFWYLTSIFLFSNWVELVAGMVGERLAFFASAGFCAALAALFHWNKPALDFKKPQVAEVLLGILILAFGFRTWIRNTDWKDAITLMGHDIEHLTESAQANNLYAMNLMAASFEKKWTPQQQMNMRKLAIVHFDRALQIWPDFFNAAYDKGRAALIVGDVPNAIAGFERAVLMDNDFMDPYYQLSELYINTGQLPQFLMNARRLFQKETERPEKYNLMARAHFLNRNADSAKVYLHRSIQLFPNDQNTYKNMAELFNAEGNADSSAYYLKGIK